MLSTLVFKSAKFAVDTSVVVSVPIAWLDRSNSTFAFTPDRLYGS